MLNSLVVIISIVLFLLLIFIYLNFFIYLPKMEILINDSIFITLFKTYKSEIELIFYSITFIVSSYKIFKSYESLDHKKYNFDTLVKNFFFFVSIYYILSNKTSY